MMLSMKEEVKSDEDLGPVRRIEMEDPSVDDVLHQGPEEDTEGKDDWHVPNSQTDACNMQQALPTSL